MLAVGCSFREPTDSVALHSLREPLLPGGARSGRAGAGHALAASKVQAPPLPVEVAGTLEACCICLDPLSSEPVTPLLASEGWALQPASCRHYCHLRCAMRLRPRRCPVCRVGFSQLRRVTREGLLTMTAAELRRALARLHGRATATVAIDLLSAVFPIPPAKAAEWFSSLSGVAAYEDSFVLQEEGLAKVLHHLCFVSPGAPARSLAFYTGAEGRPGRGLGIAARRRLQRCALRLCGAAGGACHGLLVGVALGLLGGLLLRRPPRCWPHEPPRPTGTARSCLHGLDLVGPFLEYLAPWHIFGSAFFAAVLAVVVGLLSVVMVKLLVAAGRKAAVLGRMAHRALWIWAVAFLGAGASEEEVGRLLWSCSACAGAAFGALCGLAHAAAVLDTPRSRLSGGFWRAALSSFWAGARVGCRLCTGRRRRAHSERLGDGSLRDA